MTDTRSSSALFKRAEQLKRWEESDTNKQSPRPKTASRIQFSSGIVFLAACTAGDKEEVQRLLKMGADINTANVDGLTALHQACIDDNLEMVEFLVSRGADVNRGDNEGWTPLHATASCGFLSIARFLLENGGDVGAVNYDGELPVDIAESDSMEDLLQKAIHDNGVDCEKSRNAELILLLNDAKNWAANGYVEVRDPKTGGTPLHVAAAKGYIDVAKTLLEECHLEPDIVDYEGWTPLHAAALWGQKEAASLLLKYGADPDVTNYSGQTCLDLVDPTISSWLSDAIMKAPKRIKNNNNNNNNNNKRKRSPPRHEVKRVTTPPENIANDKAPPPAPEHKSPEGKPPAGRAASPDTAEVAESSGTDDAPSWRRCASLRPRQPDAAGDKQATANSTPDSETILRRTHSFENDKTFYQRYRDVTARIKATSCPSIPPPPPAAADRDATNTETNDDARNRVTAPERQENTWTTPANANATTNNANATTNNATANATANANSSANATTHTTVRSASSDSLESGGSTKLSPGNIFKNFFKSFVPPVRDEESETQRKAHAKRVRETRRSTQGVTLDEIKSAEQFVKKKTGNGTAEAPPPSPKAEEATPPPAPANENNTTNVPVCGCVTSGLAQATATATIAASTERRPSWRLRLDPVNKLQFELEDAERASRNADATVTLPLRRPLSASSANSTSPAAEDRGAGEEETERESSGESKSGSASPASSQAALTSIQRRRRPKRRSTGVGHVDMEDISNEKGAGGEGENQENETEPAKSGSERTASEAGSAAGAADPRDYKALYTAAAAEVRRVRALLATSEQQLRDARATITRLTQLNQNSLSEIEKREKRAMERKLSEMEEELKYQQVLQAENQRLKDENGALIRVISKLSK
ncbi:protein phosphatase 1 regulatory subunit 12B isoform X3 [Plutella xylostella]|uniref:protein phosphatase 1 regulatory subunit 12B isoform X3 n=1 Tax=Plutella xylostella TaxID=51655 RepID=UPI002032E876|nr:protein phosphatase 1 regulatory subunit 12B isoform X3 [Plutella xylostella]